MSIPLFSISLLGIAGMTLVAPQEKETIRFTPIQHASFVIQGSKTSIVVDPVGDPSLYEGVASPDIILLTDIHPDHLDSVRIRALEGAKTTIIAPAAVVEKLGFGTVMHNGDQASIAGVTIEAMPMYNLTPDRLKYHTKGRGNGYVLTMDGKRIYISGDTEDIPEMRSLKNIDYAFVCMNLPYTMTIEQAASAVLEFKPHVVFPYHYRGSDVEKFKAMVEEKDPSIDVRLLKWYK